MKNISLAEKLMELRNTKGLSQAKLSELTNNRIRTIQRIENGKAIPGGDTLNKVAEALDVTIDGLVINNIEVDKGYYRYVIKTKNVAYH